MAYSRFKTLYFLRYQVCQTSRKNSNKRPKWMHEKKWRKNQQQFHDGTSESGLRRAFIPLLVSFLMFQFRLFLEKKLIILVFVWQNRNFRWSVEMASLLQKNFPAMQKLADKALWLMQFTSLLILHGPSRMNLHFYAFSICIISHYDLCAQRISSIFSSNWRCEMNWLFIVIRQFDEKIREILFPQFSREVEDESKFVFVIRQFDEKIRKFFFLNFLVKLKMNQSLFLSFGNLTRKLRKLKVWNESMFVCVIRQFDEIF